MSMNPEHNGFASGQRGGHGFTDPDPYGREDGEHRVECPVCHGHGWVVK